MENRVEHRSKTLEVQDEVKEMDGEVEDVQVETNKAEQARENMVDDHLRGREREREMTHMICVVHSRSFSAIATIILYSQKIWRFGGLYYNRQIKIRPNFLLAYIHTV